MDEFETFLQTASDSLSALVDGPGLQAAEALERAFAQAGARIEQTLSQAAQSGELNFKRMAESVLADLARIVAESILTQSRLGQVGQNVNLNMTLGAGTDARSIVGASGSIATAVALAAARGARFA